MVYLLQCAVWEAVAADAQFRQPLIQFGEKGSQAAVLCSCLWQVDNCLTAWLLHQPCTWDMMLCQGEQCCQVWRWWQDINVSPWRSLRYLIINTKVHQTALYKYWPTSVWILYQPVKHSHELLSSLPRPVSSLMVDSLSWNNSYSI